MKAIDSRRSSETAAWARKHAARNNLSLSRFVGELLEKTMRESREYERAMRQFLAREPVPLKRNRARYPSREKLHDRGRLR